MDITIQQQIQLKFRNGAVCPHCGSSKVNKFGFFNGKQRYRCKECRKTFNLYTKTLLSWSHYKDKWDSFIETMKQDLSLREAEDMVGVSYASLFYWRHKILTVLNEENDGKLHGVLELIHTKLKYIDKYRKIEREENTDLCQNVIFAFLYQRQDRLNSYIYKEKERAKAFIYELSDNIDERSIVCLKSNYPFRYPLKFKNIKIADKNNYKRVNYFNTEKSRKYLGNFIIWLKMFRGISSKNLVKYAAFFKAKNVFDNMEGIILSSLREWENLRNSQAADGTWGF
ncbi:MAG: transposase [Bacillota bacterium]|nr:transposase [Bacillota bacterium]